MTTQEKLKELFEEYATIRSTYIPYPSFDKDKTREEQILQEAQKLITKSVVEKHVKYINNMAERYPEFMIKARILENELLLDTKNRDLTTNK